MKIVAKIISRVFDPVVVIPLILAGVVSMAYLNGFRWRFFLLIFFLDAVVPGIYVVWRFVKKKGKDWDIRKREERLPLFGLTVLSHGLGVWVAFWLGRHPLAEILMGLWILSVVFALITWFWKVSVHAGVNATLVMMIYVFVDKDLWWLMVIPLVVGWARVYEDHHDAMQVVVGLVIPPVLLLVFYGWMGLFSFSF